MRREGARWGVMGLLLAGAMALPLARFDHTQHRQLFVSCSTCHAGVTTPGAPVWPTQANCTECHDGQVEERVVWEPPVGNAPTNLKFTHEAHAATVKAKGRRDAVECQSCHSPQPAEWMQVERTVPAECLSCHGIETAHYDAPETACAQCHVPLWEAPRIPEAQVAGWKAPSNHADSAFAATHGKLAARPGGTVSAACATCHARDFCASCHVNAPEEPVIQALQPDRRSLTLAHGTVKAPATHAQASFMVQHGRMLDAGARTCSVCHTANDCTTCHLVGAPGAKVLPVAGPGRARGAVLERRRPLTHGKDYIDAHGAQANASPRTCAGCHVQEQCLDCHRPNAAATSTYHPADYLTRHPIAAYGRETNCSDCHNPGQFCQQCHAQAGLRSSGTLGARGTFHDAGRTFVAGHGQAARQSLESCVSCHSERDCLTCHSAVGGRSFNPHGPGWDAEKMRKANPQMCVACHGG